MRERLAICGSHPETRENSPFDDDTFDIWVFNEAAQQPWVKRWDSCFQLHKQEVYMSPNNFVDKTHWDWLQQDHKGKVIYMQEYDDLVPNCRVYPFEAIVDCLPGAKIHLEGADGQIEDVNWFDSTPVYALVMALFLGYREIHTWGVELSSNTEYFRQLPNWVYWCGVAAGMGVEIVHHSGQVHFRHPLYGYSGELQLDRAYFAARYEMLNATFNDADKQLKRIMDRISQAMLDGKAEKVAEMVMTMRQIATDAGRFAGAVSEAKRCKDRFDPIPRQEFERRAAQAQKDGKDRMEEMFVTSGEIQYIWNVWRARRHIEALNQLRGFIEKVRQHAYDMGAMDGIYRENIEYMAELDKLTDAAGGSHTLEALGVVENGGR